MTELSAIGYAILAVSYALLTLLLLISWRGQLIGGLLAGACVASVAWAAALAIDHSVREVDMFVMFTLEVVRAGAWLAFLSVLLRRVSAVRLIRLVGYGIWIGVLAAGASIEFNFQILPSHITFADVLTSGGLLMAMVGLLLVEQLHRNASDESKRSIKVLMLGIGGIFAYDLFLFSQGLMLGAVEPWTWVARGFVNIGFIPMIAIAARSNGEWSLDIFVSRQVVFYSTTLAAVGVYLLLMAGVGYWIVIQERAWSSLVSVVFFVGAGVLLVLLLFSSSLRARLRVFLSKHFFRNKYDYREEWLRLISTLGEIEISSAKEIAVKALAQIVRSPSGVLWLLNDDKSAYQLVASYNRSDAVPPISAQDSIVSFIVKGGWLVDLEEFKQNPGLYEGMLLPAWLAESDDAWLVAPLFARSELIGLILLDKATGPLKLNYEDRDLLKTVGNHVAVHLVQDSTDEQLAEARQFEAYNRLTAFLMHDLNNLIAQQSLIVSNAEKHKRNPEFVDDAMNTIANSVDRMKQVMTQLKRGEASMATQTIEVRFAVSTAVDRCAGRSPEPRLEFNDDDASIEVDVEQLIMVIVHLIRNAQDSTSSAGQVLVSTTLANGQVSITVADDGSGMTREFLRDRLFRPFDSTKGSQGMGIGAYQAREFARKMGGDIEVSSEVSKGTSVTLRLPAD